MLTAKPPPFCRLLNKTLAHRHLTAAGYGAIRSGWPPGAAGAPTPDQLKRLLRQAHAFQPGAAAKDGVALELARLTLAQVGIRGGLAGG
jgi:hypothetical protein